MYLKILSFQTRSRDAQARSGPDRLGPTGRMEHEILLGNLFKSQSYATSYATSLQKCTQTQLITIILTHLHSCAFNVA